MGLSLFWLHPRARVSILLRLAYRPKQVRPYKTLRAVLRTSFAADSPRWEGTELDTHTIADTDEADTETETEQDTGR
jgi:hypothetical protein